MKTIPLKTATREELLAVLAYFAPGIRDFDERDSLVIRDSRVSKLGAQLDELLAGLLALRGLERYAEWRAIHAKIDRLQKKLDDLME